jgi:hypothetical protein
MVMTQSIGMAFKDVKNGGRFVIIGRFHSSLQKIDPTLASSAPPTPVYNDEGMVMANPIIFNALGAIGPNKPVRVYVEDETVVLFLPDYERAEAEHRKCSLN